MKNLLAILVAVCLLGANRYELEGIRVIDGDSIEADVRLDYGVSLHKATIRFADVDTWEATNHRRTVIITPAELKRGQAATIALRKLLDNAKRVTIEPVSRERDGYGRLLGRIYADGESVAEWLKERGHARVSD